MAHPVCRLTDPSQCDAHGTPGPSDRVSPNVLVHNRGALRTQDTGAYPSSCYPSGPVPSPAPVPGKSNPTPPPPAKWRALEGAAQVWINGELLVGLTYETAHSHSPGKMTDGAADVLVGGETTTVHELARKEAIDQIDDALASLDRWNEEDRRLFREWFGDDSEELRQKMRQGLLESRERLGTVKFVSLDDPNLFGQVSPNDSSTIRVGEVYWNVARRGVDSKADTLIHEASHFRDTQGTGDHVYGVQAARELARTDPKKAQNNADSVAYWTDHVPRRR